MPLWHFGGTFMERDLKEKLERNIWITRKCRINASERLLKSAKFVEFLNVYYSIFVITLSLLSLIQHNDQFSFASIVLSIALTISIVYANTTGLRDRSTVLKQNYIDLQVLLDQLFYIEATETEKVLTVSDKYAELLKLSENHLSIDLYRVKSTSSDTNFKMDRIEWVKYILLVLWDCLWRLFLVAVPVIGTIYLFFAG
ncbi:MAG: SLATT domain-containing protein [Oscillibacter sp.]|jgi:hypothetical protein|nr:SLATT domain-containing protein [Oscillibacter sp.]